jgi:hypothetical protein
MRRYAVYPITLPLLAHGISLNSTKFEEKKLPDKIEMPSILPGSVQKTPLVWLIACDSVEHAAGSHSISRFAVSGAGADILPVA